jgi:NAD dependent epimerase/dehydratase
VRNDRDLHGRESYSPPENLERVSVGFVDVAGSSWEGRRVVVTGAAGFIGSHLTEQLLAVGARVCAFVRYNSRNDDGLLEPLAAEHDELRIVRDDVRDLDTIGGVVDGAEVVFHLAALVGIPYSYVHVGEVVGVNVLGTLNVLTAAKEARTDRVVVASTSEVYGSARTVPMDETHPKQPQSPYAGSKVGSDALALSFHAAFGLPVTVVRPFNTYGPRQSDRAIIPTIISQALVGDEVVLGNLSPRRDFTYATDTAAGFIAAASAERTVGQELNLGTGQDVSVGELAKRIGSLLERDLRIRESQERVRPPTSEVDRLVSDNSKARELAGWEPHIPLDEGLDRTIAWIRSHPELYDPTSYRI